MPSSRRNILVGRGCLGPLTLHVQRHDRTERGVQPVNALQISLEKLTAPQFSAAQRANQLGGGGQRPRHHGSSSKTAWAGGLSRIRRTLVNPSTGEFGEVRLRPQIQPVPLVNACVGGKLDWRLIDHLAPPAWS